MLADAIREFRSKVFIGRSRPSHRWIRRVNRVSSSSVVAFRLDQPSAERGESSEPVMEGVRLVGKVHDCRAYFCCHTWRD